jgi:hypothetical protein
MVQSGLVEAVPEAIQGAQEQVAKNLALQREGMGRSYIQGRCNTGHYRGYRRRRIRCWRGCSKCKNTPRKHLLLPSQQSQSQAQSQVQGRL